MINAYFSKIIFPVVLMETPLSSGKFMVYH